MANPVAHFSFIGDVGSQAAYTFPTGYTIIDPSNGTDGSYKFRQSYNASTPSPGIESGGLSTVYNNKVITTKAVIRSTLGFQSGNTMGSSSTGHAYLTTTGNGLFLYIDENDAVIVERRGPSAGQTSIAKATYTTGGVPDLSTDFEFVTTFDITTGEYTVTINKTLVTSGTYTAITTGLYAGLWAYGGGYRRHYASTDFVIADPLTAGYTHTFTGDADANPYTNAALTPFGTGVRIKTGFLASAVGGSIGGVYLATVPASQTTLSSRVVHDAAPTGDPNGPILIDSAGNGYVLFISNGGFIYLREIAVNAYGPQLAFLFTTDHTNNTLELIYSDGVVTALANGHVVATLTTSLTGLKPGYWFEGANTSGAGANILTLSYGATGVVVSNTAAIGSTGNTLVANGLGTLTALTIDSVSIPVSNGLYSVPLYINGVDSPRLGSQAAVATDSGGTHNTTVIITPPTGYQAVTIGSTIDTGDFSINKAFTAGLVAGYVILYPYDGTGTVATDGTVVNFATGQHKFYAQYPDGTAYVFWVNISGTGTVIPTFTVTRAAIEGDVNISQNIASLISLNGDGWINAANMLSYSSLQLEPTQNYSTANATLVSIGAKQASAYSTLTADTVIWGAGAYDVLNNATTLTDMQNAFTTRYNYFKAQNKRQIITVIPPITQASGVALTSPQLTKLKAFNTWLLSREDLANKISVIDDYNDLVIFGTDNPNPAYFHSDSGQLIRLSAAGALRRADTALLQLAGDGLVFRTATTATTNNIFTNGLLTGTTGTITSPAVGQTATGTTGSGVGGSEARTFSVVSSGVRIQFNPTQATGVKSVKLATSANLAKDTGYITGDRVQAFAYVTINSLTNSALPYLKASHLGGTVVDSYGNYPQGNLASYTSTGQEVLEITTPIWEVTATDTSVSLELIGISDVASTSGTMDFVVNGFGLRNLSTGEVTDLIPNPDTYPPVVNAEVSTNYVVSDILVDGASSGDDINISVSGGVEYAINSGSGYGSYTTSPGVIRNGYFYRIRMQSLPTLSTSQTPQVKTGVVTIGGNAANFVITNRTAVPAAGLEFELKNIETTGHPFVAQGLTATLNVYRSGPFSIDTQTATVGANGVVVFLNNTWTIGETLDVSLSVPSISSPRFNTTVIDKGQ